MTEIGDLPRAWTTTSVGELAILQNGRAFKPSEWSDTGSPIIRIQNLNDTSASYNFSDKQHEEKFKVKNGDLLFAWSASLGAYIWRGQEAWLNQHIFRVDHMKSIDRLFLYYALTNIIAELYAKAHGSGMVHVTKGKFEETPLWLPPLNEQRRIVAKIEELFSELDKGVESLKTARAQLNVYRQAVLKHAFEGKLTTQWREENKDKLETPEQLLARIKQEREARYEQQLQEWKTAVKQWEENGKPSKKPAKPQPLSLPEVFTEVELAVLPEIPGLWCWAKAGELFSVYVGATPSRKIPEYWNGDISWISSGEVCFETIRRTKETITREGLTNTSTVVHPIGTVMLAMIGEGKTRGQAAVTRIEACHNQNTAAIRVSESEIPPEYVYYFLLYRYEDTRRVGSGNNQKALNKELVSNLPIPLPSLTEQAIVVQELKKLLSAIEQMDRDIDNQLARVSFLRQSILKKAFSGQLVPQDPSDEPASILLERIKSEKAAQSQINTRERRRLTTATA